MGMNVRLNFLVDNKLFEILRTEASERGMNISELCRERIRDGGRLERIEEILEKLNK